MDETSALADEGGVRAGIARSALTGARVGQLALAAMVVAGVALVLGLLRLGRPSLWVDESFTARAVNGSALDLFDGYHGLYYSLEKPWTFVAGTSEVALRLPSVLGAMVAAALLVVLAYRLFDGRVALLSGIFLATSPFVVRWSQQARGYTLMLALSLAATLLLLRALERGTRGSWGLYGLALALIVVWHPVAGPLLAPAHVVLLLQRREHVLPHGLLAGLVVLALGVPWAAQTAIRSTGDGVAMDWLKFPTIETTIRALQDVSGAAGLGVLLGLFGLWVLHRSGREDLAAWLGAWALSPFVVALLVSIVRPIYLDRYLIVAAPAFALLSAVAVIGVGNRLRTVVVLAAIVATSIGLVTWYVAADDGNWRGENWRGAAEMVLERQGEADAVVVVPWSSAPAATYYGAVVSDTSTAGSIWVLTWSETGDAITPAERRGLGFGGHRLVERTHFGRRVTAELWKRTP
jgi:mannosyltransferase